MKIRVRLNNVSATSHINANRFGYGGDGEHLTRRRILDIGAGDSDFAQEAKKFGATVVRIDPRYDPRSPRYMRPPNPKDNAIAGAAEELPFADNSFDEVVGSYSFFHISRMGRLVDALSEAWRVTKPGGLIKIFPAEIRNNNYEVTEEFVLPLEARLVQLDATIGLSKIPPASRSTTLVIRKDDTISEEQMRRDMEDLITRIRFNRTLNRSLSVLESSKINNGQIPCFVSDWEKYYSEVEDNVS